MSDVKCYDISAGGKNAFERTFGSGKSVQTEKKSKILIHISATSDKMEQNVAMIKLGLELLKNPSSTKRDNKNLNVSFFVADEPLFQELLRHSGIVDAGSKILCGLHERGAELHRIARARVLANTDLEGKSLDERSHGVAEFESKYMLKGAEEIFEKSNIRLLVNMSSYYDKAFYNSSSMVDHVRGVFWEISDDEWNVRRALEFLGNDLADTLVAKEKADVKGCCTSFGDMYWRQLFCQCWQRQTAPPVPGYSALRKPAGPRHQTPMHFLPPSHAIQEKRGESLKANDVWLSISPALYPLVFLKDKNFYQSIISAPQLGSR